MSRVPGESERSGATVRSGGSGLPRLIVLGAVCYLLTSLVVWLGVVLGQQLTARNHGLGVRALAATAEGAGFARVAAGGYDEASATAFFPLYPLLGRWLAAAAGVSLPSALLLVSHGLLLASFVLLAVYLRDRAGGTPQLAEYSLLALGLFPLTFYFRLAGADALLLFLAMLALYGMQRQWPLWAIALVIGAAGAARLVGIGLLVPFAIHLWRQSSGMGERVGRFATLVPVAGSGLLAFMGYQLWAYDSATVFARSYLPATLHSGAAWEDHLLRLASFEPVWSTFHPLSRAYWARHESASTVLFSPRVTHAVVFVLALALVGLGMLKRWLTAAEWTLALALLLIPYLLRSPEAGMLGAGRSAAVVFPIYLVIGHLLARAPVPVSSGVLAFSAFLLGTYAAFFAAAGGAPEF